MRLRLRSCAHATGTARSVSRWLGCPISFGRPQCRSGPSDGLQECACAASPANPHVGTDRRVSLFHPWFASRLICVASSSSSGARDGRLFGVALVPSSAQDACTRTAQLV